MPVEKEPQQYTVRNLSMNEKTEGEKVRDRRFFVSCILTCPFLSIGISVDQSSAQTHDPVVTGRAIGFSAIKSHPVAREVDGPQDHPLLSFITNGGKQDRRITPQGTTT